MHKPKRVRQASAHAAAAMKGDLKKPPPFERDGGPNDKRRKRTKKRRGPNFDALVREFHSKKDATYTRG